jgi:elongation factor Ts
MNKTEMIQELRALTQAGMSDCKAAIEHCQGDLQKAVDYLKVKGLNIADGRSGRAASEGLVLVAPVSNGVAMMEVNCQTDFVANSPDFQGFARKAINVLCERFEQYLGFNLDLVEDARKAVVATTKENIVVRRWWVEEALVAPARVFYYMHPNNKIGVVLTLLAPNKTLADSEVFKELGDNLTMQVAAMNPLAVSMNRLNQDDVDRQKAIFETQLQQLNKPQAAWSKILEGKFRKWHTEVCLLEQESVWMPKKSVGQMVENVGKTLGGEVQVVNFVRCQVGEGIETKKDNLAEEVAKLTDGV